MTDFLGNNLTVGDEVVFMQLGYRNLKKGKIKSMTERGTLIISHERFNVGGTETKQDCSQVIKINS